MAQGLQYHLFKSLIRVKVMQQIPNVIYLFYLIADMKFFLFCMLKTQN